ncbi:MAG: acyl-CoA thioesterase [Oscillospiraceae bacterium]|nr:acyl-CoA thioesterase [Oscillospiraceae bacterium]
MLVTETVIDVRYPDADAMGIVHHAVYPVWYEIARMDFFEKAGFGYTVMKEFGVDAAMVNLNMNYRSPVRYPGHVCVTTGIRSFAPRKLELEYTVFCGGAAVADATSFHVWTGPDMRAFSIRDNLPDIYALIEAAGEKNHIR